MQQGDKDLELPTLFTMIIYIVVVFSVSCQSVTSAVESEEEQCIYTGNQLQSLDAESEDTRYTPEDISQKRVSSNSPSPSRSPTCGRVISVSLVKQSCDDYQVLQGKHCQGKLETWLHLVD